MPEVNDIFQLIQTAQNILILLKGKLSNSDTNQLSNLATYLKSINKTFQILSLDKQDGDVQQYFQKKELDITNELKPAEYVVTIDYGSTGVEKVVYDTDKEQGKLVFKILPSKAGFNFDKIEFSEGGGKFDATITIGVDNPADLKSFYDDNEYLFKENAVFRFNNFNEITKTLASSNQVMDKEVVTNILKSQIEGINLIDGYPDTNDLKTVLSLVDMGGDISSAIHNKYYKKSEKYLDILKKILKNTKESSNVIFSILENSDLENIDINEVVNIGRIPFNYIAKYDLAMLFVENSEGNIHLIVESNNIEKYSAQTIAGVFGGNGDVGHATTIFDGIKINEINKRFSPVLKDLYNIELLIENKGINVDNSSEVLTKPRRNSKNKGSKDSK